MDATVVVARVGPAGGTTYPAIVAGCGSPWNVVPEPNGTQRHAVQGRPQIPVPINQSALSAFWFSLCCLTSEPNTSEIDSFSAPGWL